MKNANNGQSMRITIRLTPFQARQLWLLRNADLPAGAAPRTATAVLIRALLDASKASAAADNARAAAPGPKRDDVRANRENRENRETHADQNAA